MKFEDAFKYKLIYIFSIDDATHRGRFKIGDTTLTTNRPAKFLPPNCPELNAAATARINQYTQTAGIAFHLEHTELAVAGDTAFRDYHVHRVLKKYKTTIRGFKAREWFKVDLDTAIDAIAQVKRKLAAVTKAPAEFTFRPEQEEAIQLTVKHFKKGNEFLWNAKMRFGKTLCALEVVRRMNFAKTIIITHRPVVDDGWYDDFKKIFRGTDYKYCNKDRGITAKKNFVCFASIQDLRGSQTVNDRSNLDKNVDIFKTPWDCVIVDEAHEGTTTTLGDTVIKALVKPDTKRLDLSGTPFNILERYGDNVYTWDYVSEQRAKADWDENYPGDSNPYADLPQMHIYTYDLGKVFDYIDAEDKAFNFREFFRTRNGDRFVHERDVKNFLDMLGNESDNNYPFSKPEFRELFKHTLWIVPGVKEGKALSDMLNNHPAFCTVEIVNVAGNGDSDDEPGDALDKVQRAIKEHEYTITLSCGKLTAGVTVPEWTAVLYLAGGYSTSAANYLQTIFRVQSPCNLGGKVKTNCFVFDFAPDRTLRMITEAAAISPKAGKTKDGDRVVLGELLNFCPVIAVSGSTMKYTADKLLRQLKHAWIARAVRNGFDDNSLYNDKLLSLSDLDLKKFDDLKARLASVKDSKNITVNKQGLDNEKRDRKSASKQPRTSEQKNHDEQLRRRRKAISILRNVSIRMPLLIYGADVPLDEDITIDRFTELVDDASWAEFMPKGVTKEIFNGFIEYYDPEIFIGTGNEVRKLAKAADDLKPAERVKAIAELFATFKNPDKETVLTPWRVVEIHLDALSPALFTPDKKILDINAKTGLYPLSVAYRIYRARLGNVDEAKANLDNLRGLWDMTVAENVFVLCKTPMAVTITQRTLLGYRAGSVNAKFFADLIPTLKNIPTRFIDRITDKDFWSKGVGKMFFDGVVGNPPYQVTGSGDNKNFAAPVYNLFLDAAYNERLTRHASLIHPARCLVKGKPIPEEFTEKFIHNEHVRIVRHEIDGRAFFPTSDIKGGVVITEFDATQTFEPIGLFIPFDELKTIHDKVWLDKPNSLSKGMFGTDIYHWREQIHVENPTLASRMSRGHEYDISTNAFELLPEIFLDAPPDDGKEYVQMIGRAKNQRGIKWVRRDYLREHPTFYKWKALVPASNGSGALGEVLVTPLVGSPLVGHTSTFIVVGAFDTRAEARACIAYIKSKFCRVMLGILKVTQHNPPEKWSKVPMQDFNPATSDINWNGNVDKQLYRKYGLTAEEIAFIESKVKAMD